MSESGDESQQKGLEAPEVVTMYKAAADLANDVLKKVIDACVVGAKVLDLCTLGDNLVEEGVQKIYNKPKKDFDTGKSKKIDKGVAFPTCISVNNCVIHFSPLASDPLVTIAEGDVVKIDLGVHIDGYVATVAHTVIVGPAKEPITGRVADVVCAAWFAADAVLKMLRPGVKNTEVADVIQKIADAYKCSPVEGVSSHELKRYVINGIHEIPMKITPESKVEEFEFAEEQAFSIEIVMSTGEGKAKSKDTRTTVYQRLMENNYQLKMKASRQFFSEVETRFQAFPFSLRSFKDERTGRLGVTECLKHELIAPYPVLYEKDGEIVVSFKFTALIMPSNTHKITGYPTPPHVKSEYSIEDEEIKAILARSTKRKKRKDKGKGKAPAEEGEKA